METVEPQIRPHENPLRNLQLLEQLIQPPQTKFEDVVAGIEKCEQKICITRHRLGDDIEVLWKNIHMVASGGSARRP